LVVRSGVADDPPHAAGVASLTAAMLAEGAGGRSSLEIADALEFLGADLSAAAGIDATAVRLHVPATRLADALPIMSDIVQRPTFPAAELDRLRQQRLTSLLQARDDPAALASVAFSRVLYGTAHRYGTAAIGTPATLRALTPDDLRAFYQRAFRPDASALIVVGAVTADAVARRLDEMFGGWTAGAAERPATPLPPTMQRTRREIYLVDKPSAPQTQIRIGWIGVPRSTPDYFPIVVMNTILGGSFSSRLNLNLREKRGYTYGASSGFDMRLAPGPFSAQAGVQTDRSAEAITEFFSELNAIRTRVPDDELRRAKNFVALRFPGTFETTADIARRLEDAYVYSLPPDFFERYVPNIEAVTADDVQRVATRYIQPDRFAVVVVGDRTIIEPRIRALGLGPISVLTIDELFSVADNGAAR
jgi:predicted Zn-dependent peptidase